MAGLLRAEAVEVYPKEIVWLDYKRGAFKSCKEIICSRAVNRKPMGILKRKSSIIRIFF